MRHRLLRLVCASCACVLIALPSALRAQESEAVPPWGKALSGQSPGGVEGPHEEKGEAKEATEHENAPEAEESRPLRFWIEADYLLWFTRNTSVPPLLTRGQTTDPLPGALGSPGTKFLYGGPIDYKDRSGARFAAGIQFGPENAFGFDAGYLFLTARTIGTTLTSPGNPVLARPFFNLATNREDSSIVTYPGAVSGTVDINNSSSFQGFETNLSARVWCEGKNRLTLLAGFRYLNLDEDLNITEVVTGQAKALQFAGININVSDRFALNNDFFGGQIGVRSEYHFGKFELDVVAKIALGDSRETSTVSGRTVANTAIPINAPAGLLALASNSGTFTRNAFAVVPEVGVNLGLRITERFSAFAGYTFIYWSDVARPGDQIDRNLNPNLIPTSNTFGTPGGPARPAPGIRSTDFYAHGLNVGLSFRY